MENKNELLLREALMGKLLVKMAVPATLGIILYNLYNIINTLYVARGIGTFAAGGIAVTTPVFLILAAVSTTHYFFLSGKSSLKIESHHFLPDFKLMKEIVTIGMPSFVQIASKSLSIIIVNNFFKIYVGSWPSVLMESPVG